jgi:hypothetical protein
VIAKEVSINPIIHPEPVIIEKNPMTSSGIEPATFRLVA